MCVGGGGLTINKIHTACQIVTNARKKKQERRVSCAGLLKVGRSHALLNKGIRENFTEKAIFKQTSEGSERKISKTLRKNNCEISEECGAPEAK